MKKLALLSAMFCAGLAHSADEIVIGASMSKFADKWLTYVMDEIKSFDASHDDVKVVLTDANDDPNRMLADIENFISQKVNAVIIHPTDREVVKAIAKKLKKANIPLIVVNRRPNDDDLPNVNTFVGSEEIQGGIMQGEIIEKLLAGKDGRVGILMGPLGLDGQINRTAGNKQVFEKTQNIKVIVEQEAKWDRAKGLDITQDWLQSKDYKLNVIVANNDEMAIGALLAIQKAGLKDEDFIIVGLDGTPDALEYLGKGLDATVLQDAKGQGLGAIESAYKWAKGEQAEHVVNVPFQLITPETKK